MSSRFPLPGFEQVIFKIPYKSGELPPHCLRLLVDAYSARFILRHIRKKIGQTLKKSQNNQFPNRPFKYDLGEYLVSGIES